LRVVDVVVVVAVVGNWPDRVQLSEMIPAPGTALPPVDKPEQVKIMEEVTK
jgi:hypothetical protein